MDAVQPMSPILQEIVDHHEIRKVLALYCHGCDRANGPLMAGVYLEDSWDDHGAYKGPGKPFAAQVSESIANQGSSTAHLLGQSLIEVVADEARAETYFIVSHGRRDAPTRLLGGRYVDNLRRGPEGWKIARRVCVMDWASPAEIDEAWLAESGYVRGATSGRDAAEALLRLHETPALQGG